MQEVIPHHSHNVTACDPKAQAGRCGECHHPPQIPATSLLATSGRRQDVADEYHYPLNVLLPCRQL